MLRFESFVFTCLTYRNVQGFRNGPVHEFYGLKASQMSKVCASSHEYPDIEKSSIFGNRISKVQWPTTVTEKELTSRQKEKPHDKKNNHDLTAKEIRNVLSVLKKFCREVFFLLWVFFFLSWEFSFCRESFSFCREVILFAVSLSFCCEVFLFAAGLMLLPWPLWATVPFEVGAPSIWSCTPKIFNFAPKISAVHLKIYTWLHKCSQSQK